MDPSGSLVYLVRHGDAGDKFAWRGHDRDRPSSTDGRREAAGLVIRLEDFPVDRIRTSPALRCQQTVQPIAARYRLPIEDDDLLQIGADVGVLEAVIGSGAAANTVLCTHRELLADHLPRLVIAGAVVTDPLVWPKNAVWIVQRSVAGALRARYLPSLAWSVAGTGRTMTSGARRSRHRRGSRIRVRADAGRGPAGGREAMT